MKTSCSLQRIHSLHPEQEKHFLITKEQRKNQRPLTPFVNFKDALASYTLHFNTHPLSINLFKKNVENPSHQEVTSKLIPVTKQHGYIHFIFIRL